MRNRGGTRWIVLAALSLSSTASFAGRPHAGGTVVQHGSVHTPANPYLGIDFRDVGDDQVAQLKLKDTKGVEIIKVDHDAPAGKMGLREHDVVLQMNGMPVEGEEQFRHMLHDCPPGKTVALLIGRDGQTLSLSAAMADRSEIERQVWEQHLNAATAGLPGPQAPSAALPTGDVVPSNPVPSSASISSRYSKSFLGGLLTSPTYTGLMLEAMSPQLGHFFGVPTGAGLLVRSVVDNSPAAMAGLTAGDVVLRVNSLPVSNMSRWAKAIREAKGRPITLTVMRDRQEHILSLTPDIKRRSSLELPAIPSGPTAVASLTRS